MAIGFVVDYKARAPFWHRTSSITGEAWCYHVLPCVTMLHDVTVLFAPGIDLKIGCEFVPRNLHILGPLHTQIQRTCVGMNMYEPIYEPNISKQMCNLPLKRQG